MINADNMLLFDVTVCLVAFYNVSRDLNQLLTVVNCLNYSLRLIKQCIYSKQY